MIQSTKESSNMILAYAPFLLTMVTYHMVGAALVNAGYPGDKQISSPILHAAGNIAVDQPKDPLLHQEYVSEDRSSTEVSYEAAHTKIRRCIYGCSTITLSPTASLTLTSTVTVLPVTLPCSLVICPPCGCITQTVSLKGCPIITTVFPPNSTVTATADITITYVTVTETVTDCTTSTCPTVQTVTVVPQQSATTLTQFSTQKIFVTPTTSSSCYEEPPPGPPLETIDPGCPCGFVSGEEGEEILEEHAREVCPGACPPEEDCCCDCEYYNINYLFFNAAHNQGEHGSNRSVPTSQKKHKCGRKKKQFLLSSARDDVCSTLIVCDSPQFKCPGSVKHPPSARKRTGEESFLTSPLADSSISTTESLDHLLAQARTAKSNSAFMLSPLSLFWMPLLLIFFNI